MCKIKDMIIENQDGGVDITKEVFFNEETMQIENVEENKCGVCSGTFKCPLWETEDDQSKKEVPCPECCKDFYEDGGRVDLEH
jgi:DNA-directed RNA polymerase subunit RPC12/RpoP